MEIFLINKNTKEVKNTYTNVINWGPNFVEFYNGNFRGKIYCNNDEYFTDTVEEGGEDGEA